jgi:hypothetical protein
LYGGSDLNNIAFNDLYELRPDISFIKLLPAEAIGLILTFLDYRALFHAELVSRAWQAIVQPLWRREYDRLQEKAVERKLELEQMGYASFSYVGTGLCSPPSLVNYTTPKRALMDYYFSLNFYRLPGYSEELVWRGFPQEEDPVKRPMKLVIVGDGAVCVLFLIFVLVLFQLTVNSIMIIHIIYFLGIYFLLS